MNPRDAIVKALTPGDMFNQKNHIWRSIRTLTQFATCDQAEVLNTLDEHFQGMVSVKPNTSHPEHGPLVALNEHLPIAGVNPVAIMGGPAVLQPHPGGGIALAEQPGFDADPAEMVEAPVPQDEELDQPMVMVEVLGQDDAPEDDEPQDDAVEVALDEAHN